MHNDLSIHEQWRKKQYFPGPFSILYKMYNNNNNNNNMHACILMRI
jgi:hypothetical protein